MISARLLCLIPLLFASLGMAKREPALTVRFFAEAHAQDTERFATPVRLTNPARDAFLEKVPVISERQIKAIYPFPASDGSWGCAFKLDDSGRIRLEVVSTERRGSSMVVFVATKKGAHQVLDMVIDRPVRDGIISIQRGLTELEIEMLKQQFGPKEAKRRKAERL